MIDIILWILESIGVESAFEHPIVNRFLDLNGNVGFG